MSKKPNSFMGWLGRQIGHVKRAVKQDVPQIIPMELVKVTKDNLGTWARQLKTWGFTDVPEAYLKLP